MLEIIDALKKNFRIKIKATEYAMVYGSHHVIKDANNPNQQHFYDTDLWSTYGHRLDGLIPENYIVYGELVGFVPNTVTPIQKNYTYQSTPGMCTLFVYRVAVVNEQGTVADLSWGAVKDFCKAIGVMHVPELWEGRLWELQSKYLDMRSTLPTFLEAEFMDTRYRERGYGNALPLDKDAPCDEGICIRIDDGLIPTIVKAKSPLFYQHETAQLDEGKADIESAEAIDEN